MRTADQVGSDSFFSLFMVYVMAQPAAMTTEH